MELAPISRSIHTKRTNKLVCRSTLGRQEISSLDFHPALTQNFDIMADYDDIFEGKPLILVVEDDPDHLILVQRWLIGAGYLVDGASQGRQALARIEQQRPDLIITDWAMDEMDGLQLLEQVHLQDPLLPVLMVSGEAGIPEALSAVEHGVVGFIQKPVEQQALLKAVADILAHLSTPGADGGNALARCYVHRSPKVTDLLQRAQQLVSGHAPILIHGPEGSGRQQLARCIHEVSESGDGPFITFNCGALPQQLLEAELFGYSRGDFTGATNDQPGLLQRARGGTLLLRSIEELPLPLQTRLVQVLDDTGAASSSSEGENTGIRLIATSNCDPEELGGKDLLKQELLYRLGVPLHVPPLNQRHEDIPALVERFLQELGEERGQTRHFATEALKQLVLADWTGNVSQLRRVVDHCYLMTPGDTIPVSVVNDTLAGQTQAPPTLDEARLAFERRYLAGILRATNGNVTNAARLAGRNRTEFYKLLHRHELDPAAFRTG